MSVVDFVACSLLPGLVAGDKESRLVLLLLLLLLLLFVLMIILFERGDIGTGLILLLLFDEEDEDMADEGEGRFVFIELFVCLLAIGESKRTISSVVIVGCVV